MRTLGQVHVSDILAQLDAAPTVHVRLALSREDDIQWVVRSLVVDVFPARWLDTRAEVFTAYTPPHIVHQDSRTFFFLGWVSGKTVYGWFARPEECQLAGYDEGDGQGSKVRSFRMPPLQEYAQATRLNSKEPDNFDVLPWPHIDYTCNWKDAGWVRISDTEPVIMPDRHFENFPEARAVLIHGVTENHRMYTIQDSVEIRVVDAEGWISDIQQSGTTFKVAVLGQDLARSGSRVALKGDRQLYLQKEVSAPGTVAFTLERVPSSQLTFVLIGQDHELDKRFYSPRSTRTTRTQAPITTEGMVGEAPADMGTTAAESSSRTQRVRGNDEVVKAPPTMKSRAVKRTRVQVLRVVVASPSDVNKERECLDRVIQDLNRGLAGELRLRLELWGWDTDTYPGFHVDGPHGAVDHRMHVEGSDIVIGIFWKRFGTPVSDAGSGTQHELEKARTAWRETGRPHVMVYFNQQPPALKNLAEIDQYRAVQEYKERLAKEGLLGSYRGNAQFERHVRQHLELFLRERYGQTK